MNGQRRDWFGTGAFAVLNLLGLAAYLHPFIFASTVETESRWFAHQTDGPIIFALLATLCLVLVLADVTGGLLNSRSLAALGVLSAMAAALRTITLPAGANGYFFLVILGGYTFGARFGFLLGALSFFLSAIITGGFGPWLPFQMFAAAWIGLSVGLLRRFGSGKGRAGWRDVAIVVAAGIAWGFLYGFITNLWFWPFVVGGSDISYAPGLGVDETIRRYWNFYLLTSAGWDLARAVVNGVVLLFLSKPLLRALVRFHDRFNWEAVRFEVIGGDAARERHSA